MDIGFNADNGLFFKSIYYTQTKSETISPSGRNFIHVLLM